MGYASLPEGILKQKNTKFKGAKAPPKKNYQDLGEGEGRR